MKFLLVLIFFSVVVGDRFIGIGDWGNDGNEQYDTARTLSKWCLKKNCDLIVSLGDNFYMTGVESVDDPRFKLTWENVYNLPGVRDLVWYLVLGNHDHYGCAICQVEYTKREPRWFLPDLWYDKKFVMDGVEVHMIAIDTNTFVTSSLKYREQLRWLRETLKRSTSPWKVVVGHHPPYTAGSHFPGEENVEMDVVPMLEKYEVDLFLMGHDHNLQHLRNVSRKSKLDYVIAGGGGKEARAETDNAKEYLLDKGLELLYFYDSNGFVDVEVTKEKMTVSFVAANSGREIYQIVKTMSSDNELRSSY